MSFDGPPRWSLPAGSAKDDIRVLFGATVTFDRRPNRDALSDVQALTLPPSVGVEQLEDWCHRLERGQRPRPEQDLDLRESPGVERPESVGDLLG